jgi:hypothetical protein
MFWRDSGQKRIFGMVEWTNVLPDHGPFCGKPATIWRTTDSHIWGKDPDPKRKSAPGLDDRGR